MEIELTSAQRRELRARGHHLHPVVLIGDSGLTTPVLNEINKSLSSHGLIKIRAAAAEHATRMKWYNEICTSLHAAPVQHIGKILLLYRPLPESPNAPNAEARKVKPKAPRRLKRSFQH